MPRWKPHHARRKRRDLQQKLGYWVVTGLFPTEWITGLVRVESMLSDLLPYP